MATNKVSWGVTQSIKLIELYRTHQVLWDTTNEFYYSAVKKKDAWAEIAAEMDIPVAEVCKKMKSLMASFRAQKAKGTRSIGTGKGRKEIYISKWFAFKHMLFLVDRDKPRGTVDTISQDLENITNGTFHDEDEESDGGVEDRTTLLDTQDDYESAQISTESINLDVELDEQQEEASELAGHRESPIADNQSSISNAEQNTSHQNGRSRRQASSKKKDDRQQDRQLGRAFALLEKAATNVSVQPQYGGLGKISDKHTTFGLHIAEKLREYSPVTVSHVQYEINKILFAADLGRYEKRLETAVIPHSYGSQPLTPHSYGSQPPTPHSYGSQPSTPHSYDLSEELPVPEHQNNLQNEKAECEITHTLMKL